MNKTIVTVLFIGLAGMSFTALAVDPAGTQKLRDKLTPSEPCCQVIAVDAKTGLVTARDQTTGKTFMFSVNDKAMLRGLRAGDAVQANFAAGQVAIRKYGATPCCTIVP